MAARLSGPRTTNGIRRVLVVAAVAVATFGVAIKALANDARLGCVAGAPRDPAYQARLLSESQVASTQYDVEVNHDGQPVTGAKVCLAVAMAGMIGMGGSNTGHEVAPGVYRVLIVFPMVGAWEGAIQITENGHPAVSIPLAFTVT